MLLQNHSSVSQNLEQICFYYNSSLAIVNLSSDKNVWEHTKPVKYRSSSPVLHAWILKVKGIHTRSPNTSMKPNLSAIMSHL